jgi:glycosyltransferase involved in cell wall biosynthesis
LTAIGDRNLTPVTGYRGSSTFGYTFVENTLGDQAKENARTYEKIFCGSTWCRDRLDEAGIHNVDVLIQGVDTTLFRPADPRPDDGMFIIFSGGKFEYRKGQDLVLKAIRILQEKYNNIVLINAWRNVWPETMKVMKVSPHISFELKGDSWAEQMEHLYRLNDIDSQRVLTLDLVAHESLPQLFARTDVAIFPNRCEGGTNLVMMEYMACGRPVIATNFSGHQDVVNANNAMLLNHLSPCRLFQAEKMIADWREPSVDEIVARVEFAYQQRDVVRELGRRGAAHIEQFTWSNAAKKALAVMGLARESDDTERR